MNVRVRLNHTYDSDLVISLVHPDGTVIALANKHGSSGDNFGSGATDCCGTFTVFDDAASTAISSGTAPFAGSYKPDALLSTFNGKSVTGTWKLRVADTAGGDTGTIYCFQLDISRQSFICCTSPPLIVSPRSVPPNSVAFSYDSISGKTYVVEAKTNVVATNWAALRTNVGDGSRQSYTNSTTGSPRSYFRLRTQ